MHTLEKTASNDKLSWQALPGNSKESNEHASMSFHSKRIITRKTILGSGALIHHSKLPPKNYEFLEIPELPMINPKNY